MATNSGAKFTINSTPSADAGYDALASATLDLQLEASPALDIRSCQYSVFLKTDGAPTPTFSSSGIASPPTSIVQMTLGAGAHSYAIRCQTNGGEAVKGPDGKDDWSVNTTIRIVSVRDANGLRRIVVGERLEYDPIYGWTKSWNEGLDALAAAIAPSPYASTPEAVVIGAGAVGGSSDYSPGNHVHPVAVGTATAITIGASAAAGGGTALAGAAHVHALAAPTVISSVSAAAGSLGASSVVAREDHAHQVSTGTPVNIGTANSAGVANTLPRSDHVHALSFATVNTILAGANSAISINGYTLTGGGFIGPYFQTSAANPATSGLLRGTHNTVLVASIDNGVSADVPLLSYGVDGADILTLGDSVIPGMRLRVASGRDFEFYHDTDAIYVLSQGSIAVGATNTFYLVQPVGSGAGQDATIEAQGGAATFAGADLNLKSGAAGTGSTSGALNLDARKNAAGTATGSIVMMGDATTFAEFSHNITSNTTTAEFAANTTVVDTKELAFDASNIAMFATSGSYGSGTGILYIGPAATEPTADETTGTLIWSKDTALKARNECRAILCPELEGAVSGETAWIPQVKAIRFTTTDGALTLAYSYAIPAHTIGDIEIVILGKCHATGDWTRTKETGAIVRFGGNATWTMSTQEVQPFGATLTYSTAISGGGGELEIKVQGINPETVKWLIVVTVNQLTTLEV